jgi:hypothetical protein
MLANTLKSIGAINDAGQGAAQLVAVFYYGNGDRHFGLAFAKGRREANEQTAFRR